MSTVERATHLKPALAYAWLVNVDGQDVYKTETESPLRFPQFIYLSKCSFLYCRLRKRRIAESELITAAGWVRVGEYPVIVTTPYYTEFCSPNHDFHNGCPPSSPSPDRRLECPEDRNERMLNVKGYIFIGGAYVTPKFTLIDASFRFYIPGRIFPGTIQDTMMVLREKGSAYDIDRSEDRRHLTLSEVTHGVMASLRNAWGRRQDRAVTAQYISRSHSNQVNFRGTLPTRSYSNGAAVLDDTKAVVGIICNAGKHLADELNILPFNDQLKRDIDKSLSKNQEYDIDFSYLGVELQHENFYNIHRWSEAQAWLQRSLGSENFLFFDCEVNWAREVEGDNDA
ncbi:hypothetical protein F5Y19DRAFT_483061 [Xylariaceae sp. FL1651]|nr:hypothetical protein F5Y19DRAFT_483061 [Xylariaceae sp. FL1651]